MPEPTLALLVLSAWRRQTVAARRPHAGTGWAYCQTISIPNVLYSGSGAKAAALRGNVGYSLFGVNIYGARCEAELVKPFI